MKINLKRTTTPVVPAKEKLPEPTNREPIILEDPAPEVEDAPVSKTPKLALKVKSLTQKAKEEYKLITPDELEFPDTFDQIEGFSATAFKSNMMGLAEEMQKEDPDIKFYLRDIYKNLKQYDELAHLLSREQIGLIVSGFKKQTGTEIKTTKPKTVLQGKKEVESMSLDAVMNSFI